MCVLVGAAQTDSPFTLKAPGAWFFGTGGTGPGVSAEARFAGIMLVYLGIGLLLAAWLEIVRTARARPGSPLKPLILVLMAWELPIVFAAPLFSRDVYSYAAQGQLVARGINPYSHGPAALGAGSFLRLVDPIWRHAPSPYGPGWERLAGGIVRLSGHDVLGTIVGFRLIALLGVTLLAWGVPALARGVGRDGSAAFALGVLNPLVLLGLLGGAHNDAFMLGLLVAGCAVARRGQVGVGLVLCALAAEVKIPALIGAVFIGWWWAGAAATSRARMARVAGAVLFTAGVLVLIDALSTLGWRWIDDLADAGTVVSWLDPATAVGLTFGHVASGLGYVGHAMALVKGTRLAALGVAAVVSVALLVRSRGTLPRDQGEIRALGWSLLAFALLGPVVWPWYESWGLVVLAVVAERWLLRLVLLFSALACVADMPSPRLLMTGNPFLVSVGWAVLAGGLGVFLWLRVAPGLSAGRPPGRSASS